MSAPNGRRGATAFQPVRRRRHLAVAGLLALVLVASGAACSSDETPAVGTPSSSVGATEEETTTTRAADDDADTDTNGSDSGSEAALTSEDICDAVTVEAVAEATGLEINGAEPSTSSTPQCAYTFTSPNGPDSNLTVAASRYTESDAQSIEDAYDSAVQINITTAGGSLADQTEIEAGDEATIVSGTALELGVLRVGDVLVSVIVPPDSITSAQIEALMVAISESFA